MLSFLSGVLVMCVFRLSFLGTYHSKKFFFISEGAVVKDWCDLDSGPAELLDISTSKHSVYTSLHRDGSVWLRIGFDDSDNVDWTLPLNKHAKFQTRLLNDSQISILQNLSYSDHCVLTDLDLQMTVENGWNPSFITYFDATDKQNRIISLKVSKECKENSNSSMYLSKDGQTIECKGNWPNACHFKKPPSEEDFQNFYQKPFKSTTQALTNVNNITSKVSIPEIMYSLPPTSYSSHILSTPPTYPSKQSWFLRYINFDLYGPEHKNCSNHQASYNFKGSYYYMYLKIKSCDIYQDSRSLGEEVKLRNERDESSNMVILPDPSQQVMQAGHVKSWSLFATTISIEHFIYLQVWRPTEKTKKAQDKWKKRKTVNETFHFSSLTYRLVNQVLVHPRKLRLHEILMEKEFPVEKGDVLGMYFPMFNPVGWSSVPCSNHPFQPHRFHHFSTPWKPLKQGIELSFSTPSSPASKSSCKIYSVMAHFANKSHLKLVEDWKCPYAWPEPKNVYKNKNNEKVQQSNNNNNSKIKEAQNDSSNNNNQLPSDTQPSPYSFWSYPFSNEGSQKYGFLSVPQSILVLVCVVLLVIMLIISIISYRVSVSEH